MQAQYRTPVVTSKDFECLHCGAQPGLLCVDPDTGIPVNFYHNTRRESFANHVCRRAIL